MSGQLHLMYRSLDEQNICVCVCVCVCVCDFEAETGLNMYHKGKEQSHYKPAGAQSVPGG
jgi:hypothetical protein